MLATPSLSNDALTYTREFLNDIVHSSAVVQSHFTNAPDIQFVLKTECVASLPCAEMNLYLKDRFPFDGLRINSIDQPTMM